MATRILDARKTGNFNNWADLQGRVKGVGDGNARKFSADGLTVNGTAYTASAAPAAKVKGASKKSRRSGQVLSDFAQVQPKKARTSSRRAIVSATPRATSSRVYGASKSR